METPEATEFLQHSGSVLGWGDLSERTVLVIGCGHEINFAPRIFQLFPNVKFVSVIEANVREAMKAAPEINDPRIEHCPLDIKYWGPGLRGFVGYIDVIISYHNFNALRKRRQAFQNINCILKPGGTGALLFPLTGNIYDWTKEIYEIYSRRASDVCTVPESHDLKYQASHYKEILEKDFNFEVVECEDVHYCHEFESDAEWNDYISKVCPIYPNIPVYAKHCYLDDALRIYLKYNPRNEQGRTCVKYQYARILFRKPGPPIPEKKDPESDTDSDN